MSVKLESTTDSKEAVTAALGDLAQGNIVQGESVVETKPSAETTEDSEPTELEAKNETDEEDESDQAAAEVKPKKPGGYKRKIGKLKAELSELQKDREYWREQALKTSKSQPEKPTAEVVAADGEPNPDKFDSHADYLKALMKWEVKQERLANEQKAKETQVSKDFQSKVNKHIERVTAFKADHEDFDELMESVDDIPMSSAIQELILDSEIGPAMCLEFAKNREEYEKLNRLPALAAAREFGKIEARIAKPQSATKETKTTKAPPPVKPVGGKGSASGKKSLYDENLSQKEWESLREEQLAKRA